MDAAAGSAAGTRAAPLPPPLVAAAAAAASEQQQQQGPQRAARPSSSWDGARMFAAGGTAGAIARTCTAPLDRIKLLFQVQAVASSGAAPNAYTGIGQAACKILREEGPLAFWKGNGVNVIRIFPYSAAQLAANDQYKRLLAGPSGELDVPRRLVSGAAAGMTATALTHPLDVVRLRLALPGHTYKGAFDAARSMVATEGPRSLLRGLAPTLVGIAPYAAINFASYDLIKSHIYGGGRPQSAAANLLVGAASGTLAATACYPLDTVRRRMQMKGHTYSGQINALKTIWQTEGRRGFYRGWAANTLKVVPQNAIRLVSYETVKGLLGVRRAKTDT